MNLILIQMRLEFLMLFHMILILIVHVDHGILFNIQGHNTMDTLYKP